MKTTIKILTVLFIFLLVPQNTEAQFFKKLQKKAKEKIEREAEKRAERRVNKKIDKEFDAAEDTIDGKNKKEKINKKKEEEQSSNKDSNNSKKGKKGKKAKRKATTVVWSKFDFIPGDTVIFEDGPSADEENGEFPSRWDLIKGNAEIIEVDGEPAIYLRERYSTIIPYLKNASEDYLPEVFTIEFDVYFSPSFMGYDISLWDKKNQTKPSDYSKTKALEFRVYVNGISSKVGEYQYPNTKRGIYTSNPDVNWRHISIAFTKGKLKVYMDDTRLINIPRFEANPTGITIEAAGNGNENEIRYIKNIRIAKGGVKYYDRVLSDGKIIVNGIKFDINKATLKAESMGPINKIYKLMTKNTDVNFSVEGHTDSDGGDEANMTLSKARGKAVMDKLISMGIDSSRLKYNGFGESKPIDNNSTPEGKANNRRVEFVKF